MGSEEEVHVWVREWVEINFENVLFFQLFSSGGCLSVTELCKWKVKL